MAVLDEKYWQSFVGETIRGNTAWSNVYHIQKFLGRGGFGGVFKAQQDDTKQLVAVKLMLPADDGAREIKTALKVPPHPNLIKHIDAIEADLKGTPMYVLVMELADGGSLRDLLNQGILNGVEVKKIALDIVEGLKHLHSIDATGSEEQKRVHRDMKPENVLQVKGVWKIADFGLAKVLENGSMPASEDAGGTPQYMPPEFLQRPNIVSTKWDIWSFGVILAEMLAGERPFDSYQPDANERKNDIYTKILLAKPNIPNVPKEWIPIVKGCLVKKHKSRGAAADVLTAIKTLDVSKTANDFFQDGLKKYNKNDFKGAIADYNEAIRLKPDYAEAYMERGLAKDALGDRRGVIADYNEAIRIKPDFAEAYMERGIVKRALGDRQGAFADCNEAIRLNSNYADTFLIRGNARLQGLDKGRKSQGSFRSFFYTLVVIGIVFTGVMNRHLIPLIHGDILNTSGNKKDALAKYQEAISIKPDDSYAYFQSAYVKYDLGDKEGAIADYNEAIRLNPNYVRAYARRGIALKSLGQEEKAKYDFKKAISFVPKTEDDYLGSGSAKYYLGDNQGAITDYNEAIRLNPNLAYAYNGRGATKDDLGDNQGAITDYNEAIRLKPNDADTYYNRGIAKSALGDKQGAIADYNEAIRLKPDDADAYYSRGLIKNERGEALADFRKAAELYQQQGNTEWSNNSRDRIKELGG